MRDQPGARVFMSEATYFLAEPLLHNSVQVMLQVKRRKRASLNIHFSPIASSTSW